MEIKKVRTVEKAAIALTMALVIAGHIEANQQTMTTEHILQSRCGDVFQDATQVDVVTAFARALRNMHLPGGIILLKESEVLLEKRDLLGTDLRTLLDSIVTIAPFYRWTVEDGVVNLLPSTNEPLLLRYRIAEFDVEAAKSKREALRQLLSKSDLQHRVSELEIDNGLSLFVGGPDVEEKKPFSIRCKDVSFRDALNAIVRSQGTGVWAYRETQWKNHRGFNIDFIVP
jgi:hypothetical protein